MKQKLAKIITITTILVIATSITSPLTSAQGGQETTNQEFLKEKVPAIKELDINLTSYGKIVEDSAFNSRMKNMLNKETEISRAEEVGVTLGIAGATAGAVAFTVGTGGVGPAALGLAVGAGAGGLSSGLNLPKKILTGMGGSSNYKEAAKKSIEMGARSAVFVRAHWNMTPSKNNNMKNAVNKIKEATNSYFEGQPGKTSGMGVFKEFTHSDYLEVKNNIESALKHLRIIESSIPVNRSTRPGVENKKKQPTQSEIFIGITPSDRENVEKAYQEVRNELKQIKEKENWPVDIKKLLPQASNAIDFAKSIGINTSSVEYKVTNSFNYAKNNNFGKASNLALEVVNYTYDRVGSYTESKINILEDLGASEGVVSNLEEKLSDAENVLLPNGDYPAFRSEIRDILKTYTATHSSITAQSEEDLDYVKDIRDRVENLINVASEKIPTNEYQNRLEAINDNIKEAERLLEQDQAKEAQSIMAQVTNSLRILEDSLQNEIKTTLRNKVKVKEDNVEAIRNEGGLIYFRRTFRITNDSPVSVSNLNKKIAELPEEVTSANSEIFTDTNMDIQMSVENRDVMASVSYSGNEGEAVVHLWYWVNALDIKTSVEQVSTKNNNITYDISANISNKMKTLPVEDINLHIKTSLGTIENYVQNVVVKSGGSIPLAVEDGFEGEDLVVKTTIEEAENKVIKANLVVKAITTELKLVREGVILPENMKEMPTTENVENNNSEYSLKTAHLLIKNNLKVPINNKVEVIIPLASPDAKRVTLLGRFGENIGSVQVGELQQKAVRYMLSSLSANYDEYTVVYKMPNEKVILSNRINTLDENISIVKDRKGVAENYGMSVPVIVDTNIQEAKEKLDEAESLHNQGRWDMCKSALESGANYIREALNTLNSKISDWETSDNKAKARIDLAISAKERLSKNIDSLSEVLSEDKLQDYSQDATEVNWTIQNARSEREDSNFDEAIKKAKEAEEKANQSRESLSAYADKIFEDKITNTKIKINRLGYLISTGENLGADLSAVKESRYQVALEDYKKALKYQENDKYNDMIDKLDSALNNAEKGINSALMQINSTGKGEMTQLNSKLGKLSTKIGDAEEKLKAYNLALGASEVRENYREWKDKIVKITASESMLSERIARLENTSEKLNNYITVLRKTENIREKINHKMNRIDNITSSATSVIKERKNRAENIINETRNILTKIEEGIEKLESKEGEEVAEPYKESYEELNREFKNAEDLFEEGKYTMAKETLKPVKTSAKELQSKLNEMVGSYTKAPPVSSMTAVLAIIVTGLIVGLIILSRANREKGLKGNVRNTRGVRQEEEEFVVGMDEE